MNDNQKHKYSSQHQTVSTTTAMKNLQQYFAKNLDIRHKRDMIRNPNKTNCKGRQIFIQTETKSLVRQYSKASENKQYYLSFVFLLHL